LGSGIAKLISMGYDPQLIGAGEDRIDDYSKQLDYIKVSDIKDKLGPGFSLEETPRGTSGTKVRQTLADRDFSKFKKLVPREISNLYNDLIKDV